MRKKLSSLAAGILAATMIFGGNSVNTVFAAENPDIMSEESQSVETVSGTVEEKVNINYFYLDKLSVYEGEKQSVVLSMESDTENITDVALIYSDESGNQFEWKSSKQEGQLFLFEREFGEAQSIYHFTSVNFLNAGKEESIVFSEQKMEIYFGVNCEYDGSSSSEDLEMESMSSGPEVSATVATIDENGIVNQQAEKEVSDALADLGSSVKNKKAGYRSARNENVVIVLDPGHDSGHAGAQGNGVQEEVATLKIAQYCKQELEQYSGVTVYMTRTTAACPFPETVGAASGNILDIKKRVEWAASKGADAFVSFHLDSAGASAHGAHVYYPGTWFASNDIVYQGAALAAAIQNELIGIGLNNRGTESADYSVNTESAKYGFPGLIIEHAFLTNSGDANTYLKTEAGLKSLGLADANGIVNYFGLTKGQWILDNGQWKWEFNGEYATGWKWINAAWYYFGDDTYMRTGWLEQNGVRYYLSTDGAMRINWQLIDGRWYYMNNSGIMQTGWQFINGAWYYMNDSGIMQTGWQTIGGKRYYMNGSGAMLSGWQYIEGKWYYMNGSGAMQTGWQYIEGKWYYMNGSGVMQTGWQTIGGKRYYMNGSGAMLSGWQTIDGKKYHFDESSGELLEEHEAGWSYENGKWYYYDAQGKKTTGWQPINGYWYYMNGSGEMQTGWQYIAGKWYYMNDSGTMQTGWQTIGGKRYYMNSSGAMLSGWQTIDGKKYHFDEASGELLEEHEAGWSYENDKWYYYDAQGKKTTDWQLINGYWYYMNGSGIMQTGWQYIAGKWYYMNGSGAMQTGWQPINGYWYYMNGSGVMQTGWQYIEGKWYYMNGSGAMQTGWQYIEGKWYYMNGSGAMQTGWQTIGGKRYYMNSSGAMLSGWQIVDGKTYHFDEATGQLLEDAVQGTYLIEGKSVTTKSQMIAYFKSSGKEYPVEILEKGGAKNIETFCDIYLEEAADEGISAEVAFTQAMHETGWLQYGGVVKAEQFNFAGLGAIDGNVKGADFSEYGKEGVRMGIRAHIQHLKAYASGGISENSLKHACVDPRFRYVEKGCAKYVEWLGQKENPTGKGWAASPMYGINIVNMIDKLKQYH